MHCYKAQLWGRAPGTGLSLTNTATRAPPSISYERRAGMGLHTAAKEAQQRPNGTRAFDGPLSTDVFLLADGTSGTSRISFRCPSRAMGNPLGNIDKGAAALKCENEDERKTQHAGLRRFRSSGVLTGIPPHHFLRGGGSSPWHLLRHSAHIMAKKRS